jgi:hypothetical protein
VELPPGIIRPTLVNQASTPSPRWALRSMASREQSRAVALASPSRSRRRRTSSPTAGSHLPGAASSTTLRPSARTSALPAPPTRSSPAFRMGIGSCSHRRRRASTKSSSPRMEPSFRRTLHSTP